MISRLCLLVLLIFSIQISVAAPHSSGSNSGFSYSIGAGAIVKNNIRKDNNLLFKKNDPVIIPIPAISLKIGRFSLGAMGMKFRLFGPGVVGGGLQLSYTGNSYRTDQMSGRYSSIFAGAYVNIMSLRFSYLKDIYTRSDGSKMTASIGHRLNSFRLSVGIETMDTKYVDYYFGVREEESTDAHPVYHGRRSVNYFARVNHSAEIYPRFFINSGLGYKRYDQTIFNSPTVIHADEYMCSLFLVFR